jgi:predicted ribosome quality control (RQC) complex YloA/Tae2 family protein
LQKVKWGMECWNYWSDTMKSFVYNNIPFILGLSALENWDILAKAEKDYWWIHLDDHASAHVIIETDIDLIAEELEFARQLLLQQTPKAPKTARCVYSQVRWIKRGSKPGEVVVKPGKYNVY